MVLTSSPPVSMFFGRDLRVHAKKFVRTNLPAGGKKDNARDMLVVINGHGTVVRNPGDFKRRARGGSYGQAESCAHKAKRLSRAVLSPSERNFFASDSRRRLLLV